jgi:hypothetical protein
MIAREPGNAPESLPAECLRKQRPLEKACLTRDDPIRLGAGE